VRDRPCFLILKRAEPVFREKPEIKQRILSATGKE
jgi:hypothetical protein